MGRSLCNKAQKTFFTTYLYYELFPPQSQHSPDPDIPPTAILLLHNPQHLLPHRPQIPLPALDRLRRARILRLEEEARERLRALHPEVHHQRLRLDISEPDFSQLRAELLRRPPRVRIVKWRREDIVRVHGLARFRPDVVDVVALPPHSDGDHAAGDEDGVHFSDRFGWGVKDLQHECGEDVGEVFGWCEGLSQLHGVYGACADVWQVLVGDLGEHGFGDIGREDGG